MQKGGEGDGKIMANVPNIVLFWVTLPSISFKQFPCRVSQQMTKRAWSCPGEVYGVDINDDGRDDGGDDDGSDDGNGDDGSSR